jgi:hypothetical protein
MPQVSRNNLIAYIPQVYQLLKGQAHSITTILYQNQVGNQIEASSAQALEVKVFDKYLYPTASYTFTKAANQITFGTAQAGTEGHITINMTQTQIDALPEGAVYFEIKYVTANNNIILPKLKVADLSAAGGVSPSGAVSGNVFTIPAPLYRVQSFLYSSNDLPAAGKIVLNSSNPASVTKALFNNTDERGKRNAYLENFLVKRFSEGSSDITIALTDITDTSIYHLYTVSNWTRKDLDGDAATAGIGDGIELTLAWESSSVSQNATFPFAVDQRIGILLDAIGTGNGGGGGSSLSVSAGQTTFPNVINIDFVSGATIVDGGNGTVQVTISGGSGEKGETGATGPAGPAGPAGAAGAKGEKGDSNGGGGSIAVGDGSTSVDPASTLSFSTGFTVSDLGSGEAQVEHVATFSDNQVTRLKELVYEDGTATLSRTPSTFEKNLTAGTTVTFNYATTPNDDSVQSATFDGNNVASNPTGSQQFTAVKTTLSKSFNVTFLHSDGVTTRNDNNSATATALDPQWKGSAANNNGFDGSTYANLNSNLTKILQSGFGTSITVPAGEYGIFISKNSGRDIVEQGTGFAIASSAYSETSITVQYEDGTSLSLTQYIVNPSNGTFTYTLS